MKNTTKTIAAVFAVLLVATLFIGAASAERTVNAGQDAFVFEKIGIAGTVPSIVFADATHPANSYYDGSKYVVTYGNATGENVTINSELSSYLYTAPTGGNKYESTSTGTMYISNLTGVRLAFTGTPVPYETTVNEQKADVQLVKIAKFSEGYNVSNTSLTQVFVREAPTTASGEFKGATATATQATNYVSLPSSGVTITRNGDTFTAKIGSAVYVVYVNVTTGGAADINMTASPVAWKTTTDFLKINVITTPGAPVTYLVTPLYNYTAAATQVEFPLKLTKYSEGTNPTAVNQISSNSEGIVYLTEDVVKSQYGAYYFNGTPTSGNTDFIYIWYPELSIQAELTQNELTGATAGDSIDGKTVNKDTEVTFLINAPKVGPAFVAAKDTATAKIVFTTPASGKTTEFGGEDFSDVDLIAAQTIAGWTDAGDDATAGTWTAQAEYVSPKAFSDYAQKSNTITFTLQSSTLTITAAKDSVVRSNPFTVTISGKAQENYAVYLENAIGTDINPELQEAQSGFQAYFTSDNTTGSPVPVYSGAIFKTDASGKRTVQYNTAANTEDKTYTVKVNAIKSYGNVMGMLVLDTSDYDKVKVKVEKGAVTISASGDGSYYIGDEIKLTGTNTDSSNVFLFLTGQNLAENGIVLRDLPKKVAAHLAVNPVAVKTDNTWEYKWDTSQIALDTGAYTIYATSRLTNGKSSDAIQTTSTYGELDADGNYWAVKLSDSEYATVSVNLKQPFLSAVPSGTVIAQGDKLYVRGTAEGKPNNLMLYIFGPNFFQDFSITVEDDGTYEKKIDISSSMSSNQYFVVVQHPMYNGVFDAQLVKEQNGDYQYFKIMNTTTGGSQQGSFVVWGNNKLQGSQAAGSLTSTRSK